MINFCVLKPRFISTLFTLLITLQITACGSEDITAAADTATDTATDTNIGSDITTDPVTTPVAMYSYNANLSDAQPLVDAVLEQTTVYMFFNDCMPFEQPLAVEDSLSFNRVDHGKARPVEYRVTNGGRKTVPGKPLAFVPCAIHVNIQATDNVVNSVLILDSPVARFLTAPAFGVF